MTKIRLFLLVLLGITPMVLILLNVVFNYVFFEASGIVEKTLDDYLKLATSFILLYALIVWVVILRRKKEKTAKFTFLASLFLIAFALIIPEVVIRYTGNFPEKIENLNSSYVSPNRSLHDGWLVKHSPNSLFRSVSSEFDISYWINSKGYNDEEWCLPNQMNDLQRILFLGDSFTEGIGAFRSWPDWFRHLLAEHCQEDVYIMNAGIGGSDIVYDGLKLRTDFDEMKPDLIILSVNSGDFLDIASRGCGERFSMLDGAAITKYKKPPPLEYLYAVSYFYRLIATTLNLEYWPSTNNKSLATILQCYSNELDSIKRICESNGSKLLVVVHPLMRNVLDKGYGPFGALSSLLAQKEIRYIDLLPYYQDSIGIDASNAHDYYWPLDRHQKDYRIFAEGVLHGLGCEYFEKAD